MRVGKIAGMAFALACACGAANAQDTQTQWIADPHGCRLYNLSPYQGESVAWEGQCVNGYGQGHGTLTWYSDGFLVEVDDADFDHGKLNGHVVMDVVGGYHFEGTFRNHKPEGPGTLRATDGEIYSGNWTHGCFNDGRRRINFGVPARDCAIPS